MNSSPCCHGGCMYLQGTYTHAARIATIKKRALARRYPTTNTQISSSKYRGKLWFLIYLCAVTVGKCQLFNGDHSTTYLHLETALD